jgi:hypothetical protein
MLERLGLVFLACTLLFGFAPYFYALGDMLSDSDYIVPMLTLVVIVASIIAFTIRRAKLLYTATSRMLHFKRAVV